MYIYEFNNWTSFEYDADQILEDLGCVHRLQGELLGKMQMIGFNLQEETHYSNIVDNILKSSEIEGEKLNKDRVRSSVARKLGLQKPGVELSTRDIDGIVEMMLDATQNFQKPMTEARLFGWHAGLFPTGYSGIYKIDVGSYRKTEMQVVSGGMGREQVHYEAPLPKNVPAEMKKLIKWMNSQKNMDGFLQSAIVHLWFVTIHPFEDGNGRIARALSDLFLAKSDGTPLRFYSLSSQIQKERKAYYNALEITQQGDGDITLWLKWFLGCLQRALESAMKKVEDVFKKSRFWEEHSTIVFNERQTSMLNKLFDGFEGNLTSGKWAKINDCSTDTALNDLNDLVKKGVLKRSAAGGRSTNYELV
ncbi:MAG: Fic family protein [Fibrobacteraceae bacterium]|nr:Fic family protein [Fibrobacteraceae bacterium]